MADSTRTRRAFLRASSESFAAMTGGFAFMTGLPRLTAQQAELKPELAQFDAPTEPLVTDLLGTGLLQIVSSR